MVDYVWICRDGENEELRYSIRSVIKNMPSGNVWVVGGKPSWYNGNHIPVKQNLPKMRNAMNNLAAICSSDKISNEFVLMNDDFFAVKPIKTIKHYHGGLLRDKVYQSEDFRPTSSYTRSLRETHKALTKLGIKDPLNYELHVPMPMTKDGLRKYLNTNMLFRSAYGNLHEVGGEEMSDVKVYGPGPMSSGSYKYDTLIHDYISSNDDSFENVLKEVLLEMFPEPSMFESPR